MYLAFKRDGSKDTVERALPVSGHQHQVLPALVHVPHLGTKHQRSLARISREEGRPMMADQLFAHLPLGGEAEPRDGEVEADLPEAVPHGRARSEQDGLAVAWVGGEEGGRRRAAPAGGRDEGAPGPRNHLPGAYAAYLRDPGGNKICAYTFTD